MTDIDVTDAVIQYAIIASLHRHATKNDPPDRPIPWSKLRANVPGDPWRHALDLNQLWHDWGINTLKINDRLYLSPPNDYDRLDKARRQAEGRQRDQKQSRVLHS